MDNANAEFSSFMKLRRFIEAAAFAERRLVMSGGRSEFWLTRLSSALREAGDLDGALDAAEKACALAPANPWALLARAEILQKKGAFEEALPLYMDARGDSRADVRARFGALLCLSRMNAWERVMDTLAQWSVAPAEAYPWKTRALAGLGRLEEAMEECGRWLAQFPDCREALWQQAELWVAAEGLEATLDRMARLARIPGKPAVYGEIYAALCRRAGKEGDAARQYGKLLEKKATPSLQRRQVFALAKSGRESDAIPMFEELLRDAPADMYLNNGYIGACGRAGALERAWAFYHDLMVLHPAEKSLFGRLSRVRKGIEKCGGTTSEAGRAAESGIP
jgi:tetratricopeptide (TPR) repeat protein